MSKQSNVDKSLNQIETKVKQKPTVVEKKYDISMDPNRESEMQKYDDPIPSRELIIQFFRDKGVPATFEIVFDALNLSTQAHKVALKRRLKAMERDGQLLYNRGGYYGLVSKMDLIKGTVIASRDGPGEIIADDGRLIYLPIKQMRCVFHGDCVLARPSGVSRRGHLEGTIVEILKRNTFRLTGRYQEEFGVSYVEPVNPLLKHDVLIWPQDELAVKPGQFVTVEVISQPSYKTQPLGKIIEVIGDQLSIDEAIDMAVKSYDLNDQWPDKVLQQVNKFKNVVTKEDREGRRDLREMPFVTIDGEDAKDFDDAVYCEPKKSGGWRLYVAIADVSYYVRAETALDKEAQNRSTSVYFPGYVIPMLPEALSNELCSLKPEVDRLALVCQMSVSANGKLSRYEFYSAVIRSHARLTYTEVSDLLNQNNQDFQKAYPQLVSHIYNLYGMYLVLSERRKERGAIDFDMEETQIVLNEGREIDAILPRARNDAHRIIEECMLLTNVAAARFVLKHKFDGVYRVHGGPSSAKIASLRDYLKTHGLGLSGGDDPGPLEFSQMLTIAQGHDDFHNIQLMTLRSMMQAVYSPHNEGHFGLAYNAYSHFTSPIRRYPDLLTHRIIRKILNEHKLGGYRYDMQQLVDLCDHASIAERRADNAAQSVEDWLKCSFLRNRVGEVFEAKIVSVIGIGFFVQLQENQIEGLVHVATMEGDYYHYDSERQLLIGERTKKTYALGQKVKVKLIAVNMTSLKIDFELVEASSYKKTKGKKPSSFKAKSANKEVKAKKTQAKSKKATKGNSLAAIAEREKAFQTDALNESPKKSKSKKTKKKKTTQSKNSKKKTMSKKES
ncbi:ribonuclease R [Thiotrichales bacterium 19S3-7]|nr:ribonuclease R [Thiotrichales bacterium 19S3-7]MCF6801548.1 ribonuclease R [Thiotrichales bacterium 19S3-11]